MKLSARRIAETLLLAGTSLALLGHGGDVPTCFAHQPAARTFNVVGTCGAPGVITVATDPCGVTLTGDDVGLPTSGNLGATLDVGFQLYGEINTDWKLECDAAPAHATDAGAPAPGEYTILCRRRPGPTNPFPLADDVDWCRADLLPVTPTCDLHACAPSTCAAGEHTVFASAASAGSACCPTCVANGPDDPIPTVLPPPCQREACPQSCPAGQELMSPVNTCCGSCLTPPQSCLDGRAQWSSELAAQWASLRACTADADCAIATVGSRCAGSCPDAIRNDQIAALNQWASARGDELCATCVTDAPGCTTNQPSLRAVCTNGSCALAAP
jgi:hypothetical protein